MSPDELALLRRAYMDAGLDVDEVDADPFVQLERWMSDVVAAGLHEPDAMILATADAAGRPSARYVLLKGSSSAGLRFFTNRQSTKGRDLSANAYAALLFPWHALSRQVRVEGSVRELDGEASDAYFATRPRGAQVGAWASPQSEPIASRRALEQAARDTERRFAGSPVPRPPQWGGYELRPDRFEFWQGRDDRLHDRVQYRRAGDQWVRERLAP